MRYLYLAVAVLLLCLASSAFAEDTPRPNQHIVLEQGASFEVKVPSGWTADTKNAAPFGANVIVYRTAETLSNARTLIRVRLAGKTDEDTAADLKYDMDGYRAKYPQIQFVDFAVAHPSYRVFPKLFILPGEFSEYVAYLNPGPETKFLISVSMNTRKEPATAEELKAFRHVVQSITFVTTDVMK